jgi:tetratricopeptide (TPR) repeat protein
MLVTVREHALERAHIEGVLDELRRRHAGRFLELAVSAETHLASPDQAAWFDRLEVEFDNIRSAVDWLLSGGRVEDALRAISALERFWAAHGHLTDARRWLTHGLEADGLSPLVRARALWTAAHQAMLQSDYAAAVPSLENALRLFRAFEDDRYTVFALCELARARSFQNELDRALDNAEEALSIAEAADDARAASAALDTLAMVVGFRGEEERAQGLSARSLELRRTLADPLLIAGSANTLGLAAMRAGDLGTAKHAFEECLQLAQALGEKVFTAAALCALGEIALAKRIPDEAADRLLAAIRLYRDLEDDRDVAECLHALGGVAAIQGRAGDAAMLWGAADALRENAGAAITPEERAVDERLGPDVIATLGSSEYADARLRGRTLGDAALDAIVSEFGILDRTE